MLSKVVGDVLNKVIFDMRMYLIDMGAHYPSIPIDITNDISLHINVNINIDINVDITILTLCLYGVLR